MRILVFTSLLIIMLANNKHLVLAQDNTTMGEKPTIQIEVTQPAQPEPRPTQVKKETSVQEDLNNKLGLVYAAKRLEYGVRLYENNNIDESEKELKDISEWLTDASKHHFDLYKTFSKDSKLIERSKIEKAYAHDFAQLRDKAFFELAVVYIKQDKPKNAVYYLVEVVKSQPSSVFGKTAYEALKKIRFVD